MALKMVAVRGAYPNREVGAGGRTYRTDDEGLLLVEVQHLPEMLRRGFSQVPMAALEQFYDVPTPPGTEILPLPLEDIPSGPAPVLSEVLTEPHPDEVLEPAPAPLAAVLVDRARIVRRKPAAIPRGRPRKVVAS